MVVVDFSFVKGNKMPDLVSDKLSNACIDGIAKMLEDLAFRMSTRKEWRNGSVTDRDIRVEFQRVLETFQCD